MKLPIPKDHLLHGQAVEWERFEIKAGEYPLDVMPAFCTYSGLIEMTQPDVPRSKSRLYRLAAKVLVVLKARGAV